MEAKPPHHGIYYNKLAYFLVNVNQYPKKDSIFPLDGFLKFSYN